MGNYVLYSGKTYITLYYKTGVTMYCTLESKGTVYCKVGGHNLICSEKQRYIWNLKGNQG